MNKPFDDVFLENLNRSIERKRAKARARFFGIFLEMIIIGYAWYHFGWHMVVLLFALLWAINIKVRNNG